MRKEKLTPEQRKERRVLARQASERAAKIRRITYREQVSDWWEMTDYSELLEVD